MAQSLREMKEMLAEWGLNPRKGLGQNFLVDQNLLGKLVEASGVGEGDVVLEVGPGTGTLTEELLGCVGVGGAVVACELDEVLADLVSDRFSDAIERGVLRVVRGDCLASKREVNPELIEAVGDGEFSLVANLPYGAATPLMLSLVTRHEACKVMAVTVQSEVAERLMAEAGSKAYGSVSVCMQLAGTFELVATLKPSCFWPAPKVSSAMVVWRRGDGRALGVEMTELVGVAELAQRLFTQRRKLLLSAFKSLGMSKEAIEGQEGVDTQKRVEALTPMEFLLLYRAMESV